MPSASFQVPATVVVGGGCAQELPAYLDRLGARRVLVVTDPYLAKTEVFGNLLDAVRSGGREAAVFDGVQPDPTVANVEEGWRRYQESGAEALVAIGGGSSLDCAKAVAVLTANPGPLGQYAGYHRVPRPGAPLVAVPTTSGTGSEVTRITVITDPERNVKMMMLDAHFLPTVALVDYELTLTMPPALTAAVGVDTLTHAIEAYVSRKAGPLTDPLALACVRLVARFLRRAWAQPDDREAREGMSAAACQGGMAFSNSSVCLVHGMSRPVGAVFHLPHGLSNAVLLPAVTRFSLPGATARYATVAREMGLAGPDSADAAAAEALVDGLTQLNADLQLPRLGACRGVDREQFDRQVAKMAQDALASGSPANNPVVPTAEQIVALYEAAW